MREIKFRIWNKKLNEMRFVESIEFNSNFEPFFIIDHKHDSCYSDDFILMQYTGIKIDNQDLYGHDIVQDFINNKCYEVIWDKYGGMWLFNPVGTEGEAIDYYEFEDKASSGTIIVGNRYENPELLEGEE